MFSRLVLLFVFNNISNIVCSSMINKGPFLVFNLLREAEVRSLGRMRALNQV